MSDSPGRPESEGAAAEQRDERGFVILDEFPDLYGATITVKESSLATQDAVWVFTEGGGVSMNSGAAHLNREGAERLRDALNDWLPVSSKGDSSPSEGAGGEYAVPTETARTYRGYQDFTDPALRAAAAGEVKPDSDSMRWMGYADQELTRLRQSLGLDGQPGYASGRPQYDAVASRAASAHPDPSACATCNGTGYESQPIRNSASPEPGVECDQCAGTGVAPSIDTNEGGREKPHVGWIDESCMTSPGAVQHTREEPK
jgi:hypothetical protein